ncbi:MAG: hypothetical protein QM813_24255 [Verrucomicrobiota bacterium]
MTEIRIKTPTPRSKTWRRKLFRAAVISILLLVGLYFIVTSSFFFKKVVLPQLGQALKAEITVSDLDVSPFRKVVLRDLLIQPPGNEPVLTVKELRARYNLWSILCGKIEIAEFELELPNLTVIQDPDGRSNLDFLARLSGGKPDRTATNQPASGSVPQLNLQSVQIHNGTIRWVKKHLSGAPDFTEVSGLNFKLQNLGNGQAGKVEFALNFSDAKTNLAATNASSLQASLGGAFGFTLAPDLNPIEVNGQLDCSASNATGEFGHLAELAARLECDISAEEIKRLAVSLTRANATLGEVLVAGPFNLAKREGKLHLEALRLDRRALNLLGAASGLDFGATTVNASADVELSEGGKALSLAGRVEAAQFQLLQQGRASPTLELRCDFAGAIDCIARSAEVRFMNLTAQQNSQLVLQSELPQSFTMAWGGVAGNASDAKLSLVLSAFDLGEWRQFLGIEALAGKLSGKLELASTEKGKKLRAELAAATQDFSITTGSNRVAGMDVRLNGSVAVVDLRDLTVERLQFELLREGLPAFQATATGAAQCNGSAADLQMKVEAQLGRWVTDIGIAGVNISNSTATVAARFQHQDGRQIASGKLTLGEIKLPSDKREAVPVSADFDFEIGNKRRLLEIRRLSGLVRVDDQPSGRVAGSGNIEWLQDASVGQFRFKLSDVNQDLLRPLLAVALGDKHLESVTLGAELTAEWDAYQKFKFTTDTHVKNLVVRDARYPALATPLQLRVQADVGMAKQVAQIRQCRLTLTPTERAKNELTLAGEIDVAQTTAVKGRLKLSAESLDFTRYYELLLTEVATNSAAQTQNEAEPPTSSEPAAIALPVGDVKCDVKIGRLYLHEAGFSDWRAAVSVAGSRIKLDPCQFKLNGGPVTLRGDLDLGVPGYRYQLGLQAQSVPVPPVLNTFTSLRGNQIGGRFNGSLELSGAGLTYLSWRTNFNAQFNLMTTNMNLALGNVRTPVLNLVVNTVLALPDLISMLKGRLDAGQLRWAEEITARPIEVLVANGRMTNGVLELQEALVQTAAFQVQSTGAIGWTEAVTNSTVHFPLRTSLGRSYAEKLGMVYFNTPTNAAYIALPHFLTLKGSFSGVKSDFSETGLLLLTGKSLVGGVGLGTGKAIGEVGLEAGKLIGSAGKTLYGTTAELFKFRLGGSATNTVSGNTNAVAEPKKRLRLLDLFKRDAKP